MTVWISLGISLGSPPTQVTPYPPIVGFRHLISFSTIWVRHNQVFRSNLERRVDWWQNGKEFFKIFVWNELFVLLKVIDSINFKFQICQQTCKLNFQKRSCLIFCFREKIIQFGFLLLVAVTVSYFAISKRPSYNIIFIIYCCLRIFFNILY